MIKLLDRLCTVLAVAAGGLFLFITFSICYAIATRSINLPSPVWVVQFSEYSMLWITFLGTAWLLAENKHISIQIIMSRLSEKWHRIFGTIHDFMGLLLCLAFSYYTAFSTWEHYVRKVVDVQAIDVPKAYVLAVIPFGFLLLSLQFIRRILNDLGGGKTQAKREQPRAG